MSLTKKVIQEMGMDIGGHPDHIEPTRKRHIERGTHPYAQNPAWPKEPGEGSWPGGDSHLKPGGRVRSFAELAASDQYSTIMKAVAEYLGRAPRTQQEVMQVMMRYQQGAMLAMQIEAEHTQELEQLAVQAVLNVPEYKLAKEAVDAGQLKIEAHLGKPDTSDINLEPEEEPEEFQVPEIKQEIDAEMHKRRFMNVMTQGAAVSQNYLFKSVAPDLERIDTQLPRIYGQIMSGAEMAYWVLPEEMQKAAMGGGEGAAGKARFEMNEDGTCTVHATGLIWPVLVQEIVKGLMEFIAYDEDADPETRKQVSGQTDNLSNELWDINLGPAVWRQFMRQVGDEKELMPYVHRALGALSAEQFSTIAHAIMQGRPEGKKFIQDTIAQARQDSDEGGAEGGDEGGFEAPKGWSPDEPDEGPSTPTAPEPPEKPTQGNDEDDWWMKESQSPIIKKFK